LDSSRRCVAAQEGAENAGWSANRSNDASECGIRNIIDRLIEIRMVENVESLSADLKFGTLPSRDSEIFHYRQVGIKESWAVDLIATLIAKCGNPSKHRELNLAAVR
jgi:hypothetical protein